MNGNCRDVREELSSWLDGEAPPAQARLIESHLAGCASCRSERDALRRTRDLLAANGRLEAPPSWVEEARRAAARAGTRPSRRLTPFGRPLALSTMAAAALLAAIVLSLRLFEPAGVAERAGENPEALLGGSREAKPDSGAGSGATLGTNEPKLSLSRPAASAPAAPPADPRARAFEHRRDEAAPPPASNKDRRNAQALNDLAKEKLEASGAQETSAAPDTAIATDHLASLESAAKRGALAGAASAALPLPVVRVTVAQILPPPPVSAVSAPAEGPRALRQQPAAPPPPAAESVPQSHAKSAEPRRVIVTLGPGRRILAARPLGEATDPGDAAFASGLVGWVIAPDVVIAPSSGGATADPNAGLTVVVLEIASIESSPDPAP